MATLLCSMLIGAGYPAVVVSGVARAEVVENDQRKVPYPYPIIEEEIGVEEKPKPSTGQKYKLRPMPDLESHLEEHIAALKKEKADEEKRIKDELIQKELAELELVAVDQYHYRRSHAWVAIIDNASWSVKPRKTFTDEEGNLVDEPPSARFIEPSTGFFCNKDCKNYILIDSVWHQYNYYVNKQSYQRVSEIRWDLRNVDDWEHILPGEPPEMRIYNLASDENITDIKHPVEEEKHLDIIGSWVMRPEISELEFEQRFPILQKTILYKQAKHERFSPYTLRDGKTMQLTLYSDDEWSDQMVRWEHFENRTDKLEKIKFTYETGDIEEFFEKGRNDCIKCK